FQLKDASVGVESIQNPDQVRLVAQFDKKNGVTKLVNFYYDDIIGANVPVLEVTGSDDGIQHSFSLTQDAFATGDNRLVNHKQYYFMAIAYAYNEFMEYTQEPAVLNGLLGQKTPYLAGRKNIRTYTAIPHKTINGIVIKGDYGDGPEITRLSGNGNGGNMLELKQETVDEILSKAPASETNIYGGPDYPIAYNPVYQEGHGPLNVKVVDPLNVVSADYELTFDTLRFKRLFDVTGEADIQGDTASKYISNWQLKDLTSGEVYFSDTTILESNEQLFLDRGIAVTIVQPFNPGPYRVGQNNANKNMYRILADNNGFIESSIVYADSSRRWLDGVRDEDIPGFALDWIRSGTNKDQENPSNDDWQMSTDPDRPWDPDEAFEKIVNGIWAPYSMTSFANNIGQGSTQSIVGPAFSEDSKTSNRIEKIASVDIVLTPDKSKWSRSPVLEMSYDRALAEGNAPRFGLRRAPSVDKDGNSASAMDLEPSSNPEDPNYMSSHGMGWFPGYAINLETGERLNIMFGEDSYLSGQNGRDMLFNPTAKNMDLLEQIFDPNIFSQVGFQPLMGGKHYVYIMRHDYYNFSQLNIDFNSPAYDAGHYAHSVLDTLFDTQFPFITNYFFTQIMYVGMPMAVKGEEWLSNEARIRIRIAKPYERYYSTLPLDTVYDGMDVNRFYPAYQFSTKGIATEYDVPEKIQQDLDLVNIVPNPYYAYSSYERNALDNRVKIINLPEQCVITIYNMSGTRVRQFKKDEPKTSIDWDLKNFAGVPIASGIYLIHIKSDEGERVIKWFGTMRPIDLNTF
ncbi:MAG: T9SS type A sorting domain-containing protein, partial [Bacteroidetes bacterium]|nr:T9SS type A sorting domain-containing protein [Bacteroidota bacterium]